MNTAGLMKLNAVSSAVVLLLCLPLPLVAADWKTRADKNGILVESRPAQDSRYEEFRATVVMTAEPAHVIALLQDNSACGDWLYRCTESRLLESVSTTERYFYQSTGLPFPAKARDAVFHARVLYNSDRTISVNMRAVPDRLPETDMVRIREARGTYLLQPLGDGRLRLTWQQFIDPAGALPAWLVNRLLTDIPFKSLDALRDLIRQPPYADAFFDYDSNGVPIEIHVRDSST